MVRTLEQLKFNLLRIPGHSKIQSKMHPAILDQSAHLRSLIRVFNWRSVGSQGPIGMKALIRPRECTD